MRQLKYELYRIRKSRSTAIAAFLYIAIVISLTLLKGNVSLDNASNIYEYLTVLSGAVLILPAIIVAQTISSEFKDNAIRTTLTLFPKRINTIFIKLLSGIMASLIVVLVAAAIILALAILKSEVDKDTGMIAPMLGRTLIGIVAILGMVFAFALLLKQTILAVLMPIMLIGVFEGIIGLTLKFKSDFLMTSSLHIFTNATNGNWQYLGVYILYFVIILIPGLVLFKNKDF